MKSGSYRRGRVAATSSVRGLSPGRPATRDAPMIGIGGHLAVPPLPHHRAYGSRTRRFDWVKLNQKHEVEGDRVSRSSGCAGPVGPPGVRTCARTRGGEPAATAAWNFGTPRRRSSVKRVCPSRHCRQRYERNGGHPSFTGTRSNDKEGEGFRMPARGDLSARAEGRRPKAPQEGTRGGRPFRGNSPAKQVHRSFMVRPSLVSGGSSFQCRRRSCFLWILVG